MIDTPRCRAIRKLPPAASQRFVTRVRQEFLTCPRPVASLSRAILCSRNTARAILRKESVGQIRSVYLDRLADYLNVPRTSIVRGEPEQPETAFQEWSSELSARLAQSRAQHLAAGLMRVISFNYNMVVTSAVEVRADFYPHIVSLVVRPVPGELHLLSIMERNGRLELDYEHPIKGLVYSGQVSFKILHNILLKIK